MHALVLAATKQIEPGANGMNPINTIRLSQKKRQTTEIRNKLRMSQPAMKGCFQTPTMKPIARSKCKKATTPTSAHELQLLGPSSDGAGFSDGHSDWMSTNPLSTEPTITNSHCSHVTWITHKICQQTMMQFTRLGSGAALKARG
jgi:hypothetical protein